MCTAHRAVYTFYRVVFQLIEIFRRIKLCKSKKQNLVGMDLCFVNMRNFCTYISCCQTAIMNHLGQYIEVHGDFIFITFCCVKHNDIIVSVWMMMIMHHINLKFNTFYARILVELRHQMSIEHICVHCTKCNCNLQFIPETIHCLQNRMSYH